MTEKQLHPYLQKIARQEQLTRSEMSSAMEILLTGAASDVQIAGFLMGLRGRGETSEEIAAAAASMRARAIPVEAPEDAIDTCGTGGDGANTYNISTAVAFICAGCGVHVAKHGNKAVSSKSGSSEVLIELGVNLDVPPETISKAIKEAGVGFMFAAFHHKAVANVAPVRSALGVRTMFNLLGPLSNPAGAKRQLIGVFDKEYLSPLAEALSKLGAKKAWVVMGGDGLDELTVTGVSHIAEVNNGQVRTFDVTPEDAGLSRHDLDAIRGGAPQENAIALRALLDGENNAYRDVALLNAAAALVVADKASTLKDGAALAAQSIDSGAAKSALNKLIEITNSVNP